MKVTYLLLVISIMSCTVFLERDSYVNLSASYKTILKVTDTLNYKNHNGHVVQFEVKGIANGQKMTSKTGSSYKSPYTYHEFEAVYLDTLGKAIPPQFKNTLNAHNLASVQPKLTLYEYICLIKSSGGASIIWFNQLSKSEKEGRYSVSKKLIFQTFADVLEFSLDASLVTSLPDSRIITWYYNHKLGIVGFQLKNGLLYELINKK